MARVTGSLNTDQRVQRLRLWPGWNLCSLAVTATNALSQLSTINYQLSAFRWHQPTLTWLPVATKETLAAGTVLWLHASTNATASVIGTYTPVVDTTTPSGPSFQPGAGLEALPLLGEMAGVKADVPLWKFDGPSQSWLVCYSTNLPGRSDFPATLAPGEGFMARADDSTTLEVPKGALRVRYYHQDHLGSVSFLTDTTASPVSTSANYPFGVTRIASKLSGFHEQYGFTQKETDEETMCSYFEARYLHATSGRFTSIDPQCQVVDGRRLTNPQRLNFAAYCANRPTGFVDPTGCIESSYDASSKTLTVDLKFNLNFVNDTGKWTKNEMKTWKADARKAIEGYYNSLAMNCSDGDPLKIELNITYVSKGADFDVTVSHDPANRSYVIRSLFEKSAKFDIKDPYPQNKGATDPQVPIVHEVGHMLRLDHPGGRSNSRDAYAADSDSLMGKGMGMRQKDFDRAFCERRGGVESLITRLKDKIGF